MARIRSVKPTFWSDEKIGLLPREVRLTFLGLISAMADDDGRLPGNPRIVRGAVYPFDDDITAKDIEQHLIALADAGRIVRYRVAGDDYIAICNWRRHQKIDRPSASLLPPPPRTSDDDSTNVRRTLADDSTSIPDGEERSGMDRDMERTSSSPSREREVPDGSVMELGDLLTGTASQADRASVLEFVQATTQPTRWASLLLGMLQGMRGPAPTVTELAEACQHYLTNDERPNADLFQGYVRRVRRRRDSPPDEGGSPSRRRDPRGPKPTPQTYDYTPTNSPEQVKWQS